MRIYRISGLIIDDEKSCEADAVIMAHDKREATRLGRKVLIGAYEDMAGGYAVKPRVQSGMYVDHIPLTGSPMTLLATCDPIW